MTMKKKVLIAMSGGVDSSIAAHLLKNNGYDVIGVTFMLGNNKEDAIQSAKDNAKFLGIEHFVVNISSDFNDKVINYFTSSYLQGLTPNPCIQCNKHIKFPYLLKEADKLNIPFIATGHYVNVSNLFTLQKALDAKKDQSYFLYALDESTLKRVIFPIGGYLKKEIRSLAETLEIPASKRSESQEICFVEDNNYRQLLKQDVSYGPIKTLEGKIIGTHKGLFNYTIGQRKGLGIATGSPIYVIGMDNQSNALLVGPKDRALVNEFTIKTPHIVYKPKIIDTNSVLVKFRSTMKEVPCHIFPLDDDTWRIVFETPQWAPAKGQSAVFYETNGLVIGGGIIY